MAGKGLRLVRSQGMEGITGNLNEFDIDPSNTNPIFTGDVVNLGATGYVKEAAGAAANDDFNILGVFMGCRFVNASGDYEFKSFWDGAAGKTRCVAHVALPSGATFLIRGKAGVAYTRATVIGKRFGVHYVAGSTMYGDSRVTLGAATAATGPLLVHRVIDLPKNSFAENEPWFEVAIVRSQGFPAVTA